MIKLLRCVLVASVVVVFGAAPAYAETATRIDYGAPVNLRSGPGSQYALMGRAADGQAVTIVCTANSQPVAGKRGSSAVWDKLSTGTWVAHAFVRSESVEAPCSAVPVSEGDDYPYRGTENVVDRWAMFSGQCTSWVAWRMEQVHGYFHNYMWHNGVQGHWGNAERWDDNARLLGFVVDRNPVVGGVAQWEPGVGGASSLGHVAYISGVRGDVVTVQEYNWAAPLVFDTRVVRLSGISNVIHIG
jgi:surface antigen